MSGRLGISAIALFSVVALGCSHTATRRSYAPPGEQLILRDEIARSGAKDAWEVVRRLSHMSTNSTLDGEPSRMYRRGRSSIVIREKPLVIVDGITATDLGILATIRADQIAWMRILTGAASATQYGTNGGAGAVVLETLRGDESTP